jgi:hypothetical protein
MTVTAGLETWQQQQQQDKPWADRASAAKKAAAKEAVGEQGSSSSSKISGGNPYHAGQMTSPTCCLTSANRNTNKSRICGLTVLPGCSTGPHSVAEWSWSLASTGLCLRPASRTEQHGQHSTAHTEISRSALAGDDSKPVNQATLLPLLVGHAPVQSKAGSRSVADCFRCQSTTAHQ